MSESSFDLLRLSNVHATAKFLTNASPSVFRDLGMQLPRNHSYSCPKRQRIPRTETFEHFRPLSVPVLVLDACFAVSGAFPCSSSRQI